MKLEIETPDDKVITQGIFIAEYMDEGGMTIEISDVGHPTLWSRIGMLEAALDAAHLHLRNRWEVRE